MEAEGCVIVLVFISLRVRLRFALLTFPERPRYPHCLKNTTDERKVITIISDEVLDQIENETDEKIENLLTTRVLDAEDDSLAVRHYRTSVSLATTLLDHLALFCVNRKWHVENMNCKPSS